VLDPAGLTWGDLRDLFLYPRAALQGATEGAVNLAKGGLNLAQETAYLATDVAAYGGQGILSIVGVQRDFTPNSALLQGLAATNDKGGYAADAAAHTAFAILSLGSTEVYDAWKYFNDTGDAAGAAQRLGGIATANFLAAALAKVPKARAQEPPPCPTNAPTGNGGNGGFSGRQGFELQNSPLQPIRNSPTTIGNRQFSGHALDQMQNRGIPPSVVENTIQNGAPFPGNRPGTQGFYDPVNNTSIIINSNNGTVVTVRYGGGG
jgi:hypothetical protein